MTTRADVPPGSGLGSSKRDDCALGVGSRLPCLLPLTPRMAAEIACEIEIDLLGRPIGRQDQYASALGGLNTITFSCDGWWSRRCPCRQQRARRSRIISSWYRRAGHATPPTCSGRSVPHGHDGEVTRRLHRIKELAAAMAAALLAGDLPEFGALLHESWQLKRGLVQGVSSTEIDRWYQIARDRGAYGGKIAGAGGGGFFLFCAYPRIAART